MNKDAFNKYTKYTEPSKREKAYAWQTGIGLQDVDGIETSNYLRETAAQNIIGTLSLDEAERLIHSYYEENTNDEGRTEEADKVSVRIAKLISQPAFSFSVNEYLSIHRTLFDGLYPHAGKIRTFNITKKEWVLDGQTVIYANAPELLQTIEYDLNKEKAFSYKRLTNDEIVHHLAKFIAALWQIHLFAEGNTRTTAVFFIKYLRTLGFHATNDIFAENSWYFRNALVRANYNDLTQGVYETTKYLERFIKNMIFNENHELKNRYLHVKNDKNIFKSQQKSHPSPANTANTKHDIQMIKENNSYYEPKTDLISLDDELNSHHQPYNKIKKHTSLKNELNNNTKIYTKTKSHIKKLHDQLGETIFGRKEVTEILHLTPSPASELIKKMLDFEIIKPVKGHGKGRYIFCSPTEKLF